MMQQETVAFLRSLYQLSDIITDTKFYQKGHEREGIY